MDTTQFHGLEFLVGGMYAMTLFSSCMSSPWTIENVGMDPAHAASALRLVRLSAVAGLAAGLAAGLLDRTIWPAVGAGASVGFMWWLYDDAARRGKAKGYSGLNMGQ